MYILCYTYRSYTCYTAETRSVCDGASATVRLKKLRPSHIPSWLQVHRAHEKMVMGRQPSCAVESVELDIARHS